MKVVFILILLTYNLFYMTNKNFEIILEKNVSNASFLGFAENNLDKDIYLISNPLVQLFNKPIEKIAITTDENKIIQRIYITLKKPIDTTFHKTISDEYGLNYEVMVIDEILSEELSEKEDGSFKETLKQRTWSLRKGTMKDENINHILWNKDGFLIQLFYKYNSDRMDVHFIKKE